MNKDEIYETLEFIRLLLIGKLVAITGIPWHVNFESDGHDIIFLFECRYGLARNEAFNCQVGIDEFEGYIKNKMNDLAWKFAKAYWHNMKTRYDFSE